MFRGLMADQTGRLHLPPRFEPHEVGDDWVLGTLRDELGVERVRLYEIRTGSR